MVDTRFYKSAGAVPISALLAKIGRAELWSGDGADRLVSGVSELDTAGSDDVAFAAAESFSEALGGTGAGVVLLSPTLSGRAPGAATAIVCDPTQVIFAEICTALFPASQQFWGAEDATKPILEEGVRIGANVTIGSGVDIGAGSVIGSGSVIGPGVSIGRNCEVGANCTIEYTYMGNDVVVLPGARLGVSGFSYLPHAGSLVPVPQLGRTILQDRVEIGANSVIDRGALGDTVIGEGTKIGNLVVIAHNCRIGRNCMLVGFSALAGSVTFEDNVTMAGGGGAAGHITIGEGSVVLAASWVAKSLPARSRVIGAPAQDVQAAWRMLSTIRRLAEDPKS